MQVDPSALAGALDRFAGYFTAPLFKADCMARELKAVPLSQTPDPCHLLHPPVRLACRLLLCAPVPACCVCAVLCGVLCVCCVLCAVSGRETG